MKWWITQFNCDNLYRIAPSNHRHEGVIWMQMALVVLHFSLNVEDWACTENAWIFSSHSPFSLHILHFLYQRSKISAEYHTKCSTWPHYHTHMVILSWSYKKVVVSWTFRYCVKVLETFQIKYVIGYHVSSVYKSIPWLLRDEFHWRTQL